MKHKTVSELREGVVNVDLIGAGGTGSMVLSGLVRLHTALIAVGHPRGLNVRVYDHDVVTDANVGRQLFWRQDIGVNKAIALINRINCNMGMDWEAIPEKYSEDTAAGNTDIIIACVDSRAARRDIYGVIRSLYHYNYFLDCGNTDNSGQVLISCADEPELMPCPYEVLPDLIADIPEDDAPSCSLAEALGSQSLFINQFVATHALQLLWMLFREGGLDINGYYINLKTGKVVPSGIKEMKEGEK